MSASAAWLHGPISKEQAEELLKGRPDGTFLVRARAGAADHILSVNYMGTPTHHLMSTNDSGNVIVNQKDYGTGAKSLEEFVSHFRGKVKGWPVPLQEGVAAHETNVDPIEDFPFYHGLIKKDAADALLSQDPQDGVYLFRQFKRNNTHEFVLSVVYQGQPTHHHVKLQAGSFFVNGKPLENCTTLKQVVQALSTVRSFWPVPLIRGISSQQQQPQQQQQQQQPQQEAQAAPAAPSAQQSCTWYHGCINKNQAEDRLRAIGLVDGHFLIRSRSDSPDNDSYIISVVYRSTPTHHLVEQAGDFLKVNGRSEPATNLVELVDLFRNAQKTWPVPLTNHAPGLETLPAAVTATREPAQAQQQEQQQQQQPVSQPQAHAPAPAQAAPEQTEQQTEKPVQNDITPLEQEGEAPDEGLVRKMMQGMMAPEEVDAEIDAIKPILPYPDFDEDEETVEPWLTTNFHGPIGAEKAEEILRKAKTEGSFLLRDLEEASSSSTTAPHCTLMLSVLHGDTVHHVKLTQQDKDGVFFFEDKATGERNLRDAITYLSERQAGWATPLGEGVRGIKVMSSMERQERREANAAAVADAEARKAALRKAKLRAEAEARGEERKRRSKEEIAKMHQDEQRFKQERVVIRQEQIERRREQLRQQVIEDRKRKAREAKNRRRLEAARRGEAEPVIEVALTSDSEDSDDDEDMEVKEWRRRASARQFGFDAPAAPRRSSLQQDSIPEEGEVPPPLPGRGIDSTDAQGFPDGNDADAPKKRGSSRRRRSSRRSKDGQDGSDPEKCLMM
ncbi:hypothetical protein PTSG_06327 [Salpingoeca rosetta]|uniref:SH2 domain-containing protein n=1 Tax=Salpingoeca rosetta (strain ATCC 50818 / BSB-021) TaxID=946362 RepID=F2UCL0_SALR5|nr:uncharacterized protein PTSG_06327 [Salpingoeca rosetta]EGD74317.1 hypothetical protein PTSG_06327 [Salpingoeca rosetta]|eukprot:XP_004993217.1 hypothetical protein PTSG_06327 [Salpingoeca rosetta]